MPENTVFVDMGRDGEPLESFMEKLNHALSQVPADARARAKVSAITFAGQSLAIEWAPPPRCDKTLDMFGGDEAWLR